MATLDIGRDTDAMQEILRRTGARDDVCQWSRNMGLRQAWTDCERGDWLLWLAARLGVDRRQVVLAACQCARLALPHVTPIEERPRQAIEEAEAWCRGEANLKQLRAAAVAAFDAAYDAAADAAALAAHAALAAAQAAFSDYVAAVARAAARADADYTAAHAAARADTLRRCADLVRQVIPYHTIAAAARRVLKESK